MEYHVADLIPRGELAALGCSQYQVRGIPTGEYRPPEAGEWMIIDSANEVFQAPPGLTSNYRIAKLVKTREKSNAVVAGRRNCVCGTCH